MRPIRLGLVGYGKIAQDQHVPTIRANPQFDLVAVATMGRPCPEVENFGSLTELLAKAPQVDAIAFCTPPQGRYGLVEQAVRAGKHVLVEKPPCSTLGEAYALIDEVGRAGVTGLFAWHSRFAPGVGHARAWLEGQRLRQVVVHWKEQVRKWHPGQSWIWEAGGLGVFDPGINALSIVTDLLPNPLFVSSANLKVPGNCQSPIAATLNLRDGEGVQVLAEFDFDHSDNELWRIELHTDAGVMRLDSGGAVATLDGAIQTLSEEGEYSAMYRHFAQLIAAKRSDLDLQPLRIVADSFFVGSQDTVADFHE
ncbi:MULTISPECIES: Gfo/Idh/MocA family oxidoreductase [unclassified Pseudomonas]|uniref:Gfo/Idh/MocA family protein n=1 Tax=unclassified Pseudomonas TaxID=196821 RepID=UPI000D3D5A61|nr:MULTISPECIES: Gfo/Idh/MocA family oxidoreductase [unclassified Pseudomonas]RAU40800.1 gfo/Idh/MocA family oxidoreductase [Pseudomonas sp. RIT 409]RAU48178.1 gfo/Idh/MocA family oxidoreductase [Pseudomonas sp. RIT 412]